MKVCKPAWVNHNDTPICSVDIHPDGSRFATGGHGEDSGRIVIWNMAPLVSQEKEMDENVPRILCQLDNHLACVNCVRWSCSGRYLASGGDDKLVMIWSISKGSGGGGFGLSNKANVESWRCIATLRGHHGDVLDIAWSPHDLWLATCSIDNSIIVWRVDTNPPSILVVLRGHTGLVKGVSWDPVGKYLGSQSDDKSVRIWRTSDWSEEKCIKQPFAKCSGTTMVLRLSWSPDGQYLVTAHAMNGKVPIAQIIERDGWTYDKDFVGHHMAITCVRFSRYIMEMERVGKVSRACVCALGSRDRSVSVWITCFNRPVVVVKTLFNSPILDLAWGPRGLSLMACSGDGSVAYLEFTSEELGTPIGQTEKDQLFEKLYGKSSVYEAESNCVVLENPELLSVRPEPLPPPPPHTPVNKTSPIIAPFNQNSCASSGGGKQVTPPTVKQIETRRADGKRRITPIFIPPPSSDTIGDEVGPFGSDTNTTPFSSSVPTKSKIIIERREEVVPVKKETSMSNHPTTTTPQPVFNSMAHSQKSLPPPDPTPIPNSSFENLLTMTEKVESTKKSKLDERGPQVMSRVAKTSGGTIKIPSRPVALPSLPSHVNSKIPIPGTEDYVTVSNNSFPKVVGNLALVHCHLPNETKPKWTLALGSDVVGVVGCRGVVAVACSNGTLHLVSATDGSSILPPMAFSGGSISVLTAPVTGSSLVVLTSDGILYSWRVEGHPSAPYLTTVLSDVSMAALMRPTDGEVRVKDCFVTESCEPLITLSTGKAYMYSLTHRNWLLLSDSNDPVVKCCLSNFMEGETVSNTSRADQLPLRAVQSSSSARLKAVRSTGLILEAAGYCTRSYLEDQLSRALLLGSPVEYRCWLFSLVRFLLEQGDELRLRSLCEELLGPAHSHPGTKTWQPTILGIEKHLLLDLILDRIKANLKMQRLYLEMRELLDTIKSLSESLHFSIEKIELPPAPP